MSLDRRSLLRSVSGWLTAMALPWAPTASWAQPATLAQLLGLRAGEEDWLAVLTADEQRELQQALRRDQADSRSVPPRTFELLTKVLGRRSRLFAFLDYPPAGDTRSVCDGLIRE